MSDSRVFVGLNQQDNPETVPSTGNFELLRGREAINSIIVGPDSSKEAQVLFKSATDTVFYRTKNGIPIKEDVQ